MGRFDVTKRSEILGLPIGPRRTDWDKVARLGAGAAAVIAAGVVAARSFREPLTRVADGGRRALEQAGEVATTIQQAAKGAAGSSTGLGSMLGAFRAVGADDDPSADDGGDRPRDENGRFVPASDADEDAEDAEAGERRERGSGRDRAAG